MQRRRRLIFRTAAASLLALLALAGCKPQEAAAPSVIVEKPRTDQPMESYTQLFTPMEFTVGDRPQKKMTYYWFAPAKPPAGKIPLVVVLHGSPGKSYAAENLIADPQLQDFVSFILVPQAPEEKYWALPEKFSGSELPADQLAGFAYDPREESLPDVIEAIRQVEAAYPVDPDRIYIVGCSLGGTGVYGAALRYPDMFAAGIAAGAMWSFPDAPKMTSLPLWIEEGAYDPNAGLARTMAQMIKDSGGDVRYTEFPDMGHNCPSAELYQRPVWEWLFAQRKPAAADATSPPPGP